MGHMTELIATMSQTDDPQARRWYTGFATDLATRMLVLVDLLDDLDERVAKIYPEVLREVLRLLPAGVRLDVLAQTCERLREYGDVELDGLLQDHVVVLDSGHGSHRCATASVGVHVT